MADNVGGVKMPGSQLQHVHGAGAPNEATPKWTILPNCRPGMQIASQKGVNVYLASNGFTRLCRHGETTGTIFKNRSPKAPACNRAKFSVCDCMNADGLTSTRRATVPQGWNPPSYYDILVKNDTEEVELPGGRKARHIPYSERNGTCAAFMLPSGQLRCRHGNSESTLRRLKAGDPRIKIRCDCAVDDVSWRHLWFGNNSKKKRKRASDDGESGGQEIVNDTDSTGDGEVP